MSRLILVLAVLLVGCGLSQERSKVALSPESAMDAELMRATIAGMNLDVGVGYSDAQAIAKYYVMKFRHRSGTVGAVYDRGRYWEVEVYSGALNLEVETISVDKNSGRVSSFLASLPTAGFCITAPAWRVRTRASPAPSLSGVTRT